MFDSCNICASSMASFGRATLLGRHDVAYFRCPACGFVRTEEPYWLAEAYGEAINRADVGLFRRNARLVKICRAVIGTLFQADGRFVDYGGGYGLLVRLMRDAGFDFYRYDAHCENMFARGFEATPGEGGYELVTAFELFEHLADPCGELERMLSFGRNIFFTTLLLPEPAPQPGEWWYYGLDHGQHVSFHTQKSLTAMADRFSLRLTSDGISRHLLTSEPVSPLMFRTVSKYKIAVLLAPLFRRRSLIPADFAAMVGKSSPEREL